MAARFVPITNHAVLFAAALAPYLILCGAASVILLMLGRQRILTIAALVLTLVSVVLLLPLYIGSPVGSTPGVAVRLMSANLREGQADPEYLVKSARANADVVAFQELTVDEVDRLSAAGLDRTFPYRWLDAREQADGVGIWSRAPLRRMRRIDGYTMAAVTVQVQVVGTAIAPTVLVVHIPGPWPQPIGGWRRDLDQLSSTLSEVGAQAGNASVIVAGDFNSTTDMRPYRALLRNGYDDAAEQAGTGIKPTFPADWRLPPFLAIDHILTRGCTALSLNTVDVPGSDHRGLLATVQVPRS